MARFDGKVVFITGAARGQGRSHAVKFAEEGAQIIATDIGSQIDSVPYSLATEDDLNETVRMVEDLDQRIIARKADVRNYDEIESAVQAGISEFGHIDIVCANAGIVTFGPTWELTEEQWRDMIDTNLTGVWHTCKAAIPHMIERGQGGSIIITSSTAGIMGMANVGHYAAAKHGVVGLMKVLTKELGPHNIRVNTVHPTSVLTDMVDNEAMFRLFRPELDNPTLEDLKEGTRTLNILPVSLIESIDVTNAVMWLASDEARYVTGMQMKVDAGSTEKTPG